MGPILENFIIYAENLSYFYIVCILVTFLAVFATWKVDISLKTYTKVEVYRKPLTIEEESHSSDTTMDEVNDTEKVDVNKFPSLEKKLLLENMSKSLNSVELEKEKEIEKQQLASIFELIKKDQSKFQIESLQELEEQMKLYRE